MADGSIEGEEEEGGVVGAASGVGGKGGCDDDKAEADCSADGGRGCDDCDIGVEAGCVFARTGSLGNESVEVFGSENQEVRNVR